MSDCRNNQTKEFEAPMHKMPREGLTGKVGLLVEAVDDSGKVVSMGESGQASVLFEAEGREVTFQSNCHDVTSIFGDVHALQKQSFVFTEVLDYYGLPFLLHYWKETTRLFPSLDQLLVSTGMVGDPGKYNINPDAPPHRWSFPHAMRMVTHIGPFDWFVFEIKSGSISVEQFGNGKALDQGEFPYAYNIQKMMEYRLEHGGLPILINSWLGFQAAVKKDIEAVNSGDAQLPDFKDPDWRLKDPRFRHWCEKIPGYRVR